MVRVDENMWDSIDNVEKKLNFRKTSEVWGIAKLQRMFLDLLLPQVRMLWDNPKNWTKGSSLNLASNMMRT